VCPLLKNLIDFFKKVGLKFLKRGKYQINISEVMME